MANDDERTSLLAATDLGSNDTANTALLAPVQQSSSYETFPSHSKPKAPSIAVAELPTTTSHSSSSSSSSSRSSLSNNDPSPTANPPTHTTHIWTILPTLLLGILLSNIISSIVLATATHIASTFSALSSASWLLTTYTLSQSASQPLYGKLSTIFGRRACLIFCWLVFGVGCLFSGVGSRFWVVILGRAVAGVGSAGKIALTSVVVADLVPLRDVARYRAYVNLTATVARSLGGPVGGWLAGRVGWRWPFVVQFPVAVVGLGLVLWKLPQEGELRCTEGVREESGDRGQGDDRELKNEKTSGMARVDFAGAASLVATIVSGMLALDLGSKGYPPALCAALGCAFLLCMALFVAIEKHCAREPILPLDLVGRREVLTSYFMIGLQAAGQFGLLFTIPVYFQVAMNESISSASTRIVPVVVGNAFGTILSGKLITRTKRYKALAILANLSGFVGFTLLLLRWHGQTNAVEALYVALPGIGMGVMQSVTFVHLAASVRHDEVPIAGTAWFLAQNIGVLIGASMTTALINKVLKLSLQVALSGEHDGAKIIRRVTSNVGSISTLPDDLRMMVTKAYVRSLLASDGLSMIFVALAFIATISMREKPL